MRILFLFILTCSTFSAFAHEDHFLNDDVHQLYHIVFYGLLALLVLKVGHWALRKRRQRQQ